MHEVYYATGNKAKFEEARTFLSNNAPEIQLHNYDVDLDELQTLDQRVIAVHKARQAWEHLRKPVLIDDAGLYFEKYNQFPGTLSKYVYEGIGFEGLFKLVQPGDAASFKLTLVYWYGPEQYQVFEERADGTIVARKGSGPTGLPFLQIFAPTGRTESYAELRTTPEWPLYNPRARALRAFVLWMQDNKLL